MKCGGLAVGGSVVLFNGVFLDKLTIWRIRDFGVIWDILLVEWKQNLNLLQELLF